MTLPPTQAGRATEEHDSWVHRTLGYVVNRAGEAAHAASEQATDFLNSEQTRARAEVFAAGTVVRAVAGDTAGAVFNRMGTAALDTVFDQSLGAVGRQVAAGVESVGGRAVVQAAVTDTAVAVGEAVVAAAPVVAAVVVAGAVVGGVAAAGVHIANVEARDGLHNPPPSDETAGVNGDYVDASADPPPN